MLLYIKANILTLLELCIQETPQAHDIFLEDKLYAFLEQNIFEIVLNLFFKIIPIKFK